MTELSPGVIRQKQAESNISCKNITYTKRSNYWVRTYTWQTLRRLSPLKLHTTQFVLLITIEKSCMIEKDV